jgi:thioredoxin reductase (NADPH)
LKDTLSKYLLDRISTAPNVRVLTNSEVTELEGDQMLKAIVITNNVSGEKQRYETRWLFVCIGGDPRTSWAAEVGIVRDNAGYLVTGPDLMDLSGNGNSRLERWPLNRPPYYLETSMPGVFAVGDVRHGSVKRCASAVGEGAMAVAFVHRFLANG